MYKDCRHHIDESYAELRLIRAACSADSDAAAALFHEKKLFGWLVMGQALREKPNEENFGLFLRRNRDYIKEADKVKELYWQRPVFPDEKLRAVANMLQMAAKYIFLSEWVETADMPHIVRFRNFIGERYSEPLLLEQCAAELSISPYYLSISFGAKWIPPLPPTSAGSGAKRQGRC